MVTVWVVSHIAFLAIGFYMVSSSIKDFLDYNVVTNIVTLLKLPVTFPAVTLCSENITDSNIDSSISNFGKNNDTFDKLQIKLEAFNDYDYGNCLRFNGLINDSSLLRNVTGTDLKKNSLNIYMNDIPLNYAVIYITHNSLNTFGNETPRYVNSGKSYYFYLNRRLLDEKLSEPWNRCLNQSYDYHVENCLEQCINNQVAIKYNCRLTGYYQSNSLTSCLEKADTKDKYPDEDGWREELTPFCQTQCVEECFTTSYTYNVIEDNPAGDSQTIITILFSDLRYTYTTQIPKSSGFDLFGFIGGTLGMVCGFQLATFVEFLDFIFEIILIFVF